MEMEAAWELLPKSEARHNTRLWEVECASSMPLDRWYEMPLDERTLKVSAMLLPRVLASLEVREKRR